MPPHVFFVREKLALFDSTTLDYPKVCGGPWTLYIRSGESGWSPNEAEVLTFSSPQFFNSRNLPLWLPCFFLFRILQ